MPGKRKPVAYYVDEDGCHMCTSHAVGTHGYPCVWKDGRNQNLHRVLYEERYGPFPPTLVARHRCDKRQCINLDHIEPGTPADNTADITARDRHNPPRGERSGTAKLTVAIVEAIRAAQGPQSEIAAQFGVTQPTVSRIRRGERWSGAAA